MNRRETRWVDDDSAPEHHDADDIWSGLTGDVDRFRRGLIAWAISLAAIALGWVIVRPYVSIGEAAGAWIGIAIAFVAIVALLAIVSRGDRR